MPIPVKLTSFWLVLLCLLAVSGCQRADEAAAVVPAPRIKISSLYDGQLVSGDKIVVHYEIRPERAGNQGVLYLDNGDPQPLPGLVGEYVITNVAPGVHALQIKEMSEDFVPTGYFEQVNFIVQ